MYSNWSKIPSPLPTFFILRFLTWFIFSPALTDGSLGDMLFFHSFRNPGLVSKMYFFKWSDFGTRKTSKTDEEC